MSQSKAFIRDIQTIQETKEKIQEQKKEKRGSSSKTYTWSGIPQESLSLLKLEELDRLGIRCSACEHWAQGICFGYEKETDREKDAKICDIFEPNRYQEFIYF